VTLCWSGSIGRIAAPNEMVSWMPAGVNEVRMTRSEHDPSVVVRHPGGAGPRMVRSGSHGQLDGPAGCDRHRTKGK